MESRKLPRYSLQDSLVAMVRKLVWGDAPESDTIRADVTDLSREGAGLSVEVCSPQEYTAGDHIRLEITLSDDSTIGSEAEVKWIHPLLVGVAYRLGIQFIKIDSQDKARLHKFIAELEENLSR